MISYILIIFIFSYNVLFKKHKAVSYFVSLKFFFSFLFMPWLWLTASCYNLYYTILVLYFQEMVDYIKWHHSRQFRYTTFLNELFFYITTQLCFVFFAATTVFFIILKIQLDAGEFSNYKPLVFKTLCVWLFWGFGSVFIHFIFEDYSNFSIHTRSFVWFGFYVFSFMMLCFIIFKNVSYKMLLSINFYWTYGFLNFFLLFILQWFLIPGDIKIGIILNIRELSNLEGFIIANTLTCNYLKIIRFYFFFLYFCFIIGI